MEVVMMKEFQLLKYHDLVKVLHFRYEYFISSTLHVNKNHSNIPVRFKMYILTHMKFLMFEINLCNENEVYLRTND